jgi:hypothetical protein
VGGIVDTLSVYKIPLESYSNIHVEISCHEGAKICNVLPHGELLILENKEQKPSTIALFLTPSVEMNVPLNMSYVGTTTIKKWESGLMGGFSSVWQRDVPIHIFCDKICK